MSRGTVSSFWFLVGVVCLLWLNLSQEADNSSRHQKKETYYLIFNHFQINYQWFQRLYSVFEILKEKNPIFFLSAFSEQPNKTIQTNDSKYSTVSCIPLSLMFQCQDSHLRERKHTQTQTPTNPTFLFIFPFPANKHP